ncbi:MAG: 3-deoxy-D-manno-octulosonic acid kinase [Verrucomicrobia bacterium]|nr:3-deoxy-D-manno-octulosonic acid kinase [Verrucomicrobiota bacterium]
MAESPDIFFLHPKLSDLPESLKELLFDPDKLRREGLITQEICGRGTTYFFQLRENSCVLRHFWRGGFMRHLSKDGYVWMGLKQSRAYREWQILETLENLRLPAPRRIALRIQRSGLLCRSDIITKEIKNIMALGSLLTQRPLCESEWQSIGEMILKFHANGIFHQDLNANNILLGNGSCYLIDFDRGRILQGNWWKPRMLNRLKHSLESLSRKHKTFHFNPLYWEYLMDGYNSVSSS